MPQMVWSTLPDGRPDYLNARWHEFTGLPEEAIDAQGWDALVHPDDSARAWDGWRHSLATGEPFQVEYRLRHHSGEYRWTLARALPMRDGEGHVIRWIGTCTDIHEAKLAAEEREVVARELSHRIKNLFSVFNGIISLSARAQPAIKPLAEDLRGRINALGAAHDAVRPSAADGRPRSVLDLVRSLIAPYAGAGPAVELAGEEVELPERMATPMALVVHELATNSAKYGALGQAEGRLTVTVRRGDGRLTLLWSERSAGRAEAAPERLGFGSQLMELSIERHMKGCLRRDWRRDGLDVTVEVPLGARAPAAAQAPDGRL